MATRKAICLVNGLFQEVNTPTDKLDFAGNSTTDLAEGTNQYYTNTRSRQAISVTDSGGDGSLAYDNTTGVLTYTGPSASEVRAHLSASNSGTGFGSLAYDNSTGVFTYSVVTASNIRQQISVTDTGGSGSLSYDNSTGVITYTGPSSSEIRGELSVAAGSGLTYNSTTGEFGTNAIPNAQLANSSITFGSTSTSLGGTISALSITSYTASSFVNVGNGVGSANSINIEPGVIVFEGSTVDGFETTLQVTDPTADRFITFPDAGGTVALLTSLSVAVASGLTYNSTTGEFGTSAIPNSQLANSSITVGTTAIALGSSSTSISGLTSLTSTGIITNDSGFRIRNTADTSKQIAFDASSIAALTTRTLTVQDANGTLALSSNKLSFFASTTSSELAGVISDETGSGSLVFATSPSLTTPNIGAATATSVNKVAITAPASSATLTIADGKTLTASNTLTFTGTDSSSVAFGAGGTVAYTSDKLSAFASTTSSELAGVISDETGSGSLVFATSPSLTTPSLGVATATSVNKVTITAPATSATLTIADGKTLTASNTLTFTGTDSSSVAFGTGGTVAYVGSNNAFTGANTFTNTTGQTFRQAATQDGFIIQGRAGGTSSNAVTFTTEALTGNHTVTFPDLTGTVLLDTSTLTFTDSTFRVKDNTDNTKQLAFECSGISTATTRTMTVPDENGTISTQDFATAIAIALG